MTLGVTLGGAEGWLPRLEGELTGKVRPLALEDAPELAWKLTLRSATAAERFAAFTAEGPGTRLRADVSLDGGGDGTWRLVEAEADLAHWQRAIGRKFGAAFADLMLEGMARVRGEGTWRERVVGGTAYWSVSEGRVELPSDELVLEGVSFEFVVEDLRALRSAPAQMISWTRGRYGELEVGAGRLMFTLHGDQVQIDEGVVDVLGGQVNVAAFTFSLRKPEMSFITRAVGLDLARLLPFLPEFFSMAEGEVDGTLMLHWTRQGIAFGAGALSLRSEQDVELRLVPRPGLITERIPAEVLRRVPNLRKIETGEATLRAESFEVSFSPDGDQEGRSAVVRLRAEPIDPTYRAPIDLTVNFRGPIGRLVQFGTDSRLRMGGNR